MISVDWKLAKFASGSDIAVSGTDVHLPQEARRGQEEGQGWQDVHFARQQGHQGQGPQEVNEKAIGSLPALNRLLHWKIDRQCYTAQRGCQAFVNKSSKAFMIFEVSVSEVLPPALPVFDTHVTRTPSPGF